MSNFGERLSEVMFERNVTVKELADVLKVSQSSIYDWKAGRTQIKLSNLISLVDYLCCSIEYLACKTDIYTNIVPPKEYQSFSTRVRAVMKESKISTYRLRLTSRFEGKYFNLWDNGAEPLLSTLIDLSAILDVTIDYLVGREQ